MKLKKKINKKQIFYTFERSLVFLIALSRHFFLLCATLYVQSLDS